MSEQNYKAFWDEAIKQIHEEYKLKNKEEEFKLWFNVDYVEDTQNEITVSAPSEFMWNQMLSRGNIDIIKNRIIDLTGQHITIKNIIKNKISVPKTEPLSRNIDTDFSVQSVSEPIYNTSHSLNSDTIKPKKHPQLNESYTFETFVPGENSNFAYSVCLKAAEQPGKDYNPLLIYGGVGLGKTHLMQSVGNYIFNERENSLKICYITAENFVNEFTSSLRNTTPRNNSIEKFKNKYRNLDVLLIDDIHFLQGKEQTQEEFFHTFEALYNKKSQMIFTCDRPISELKDMEARLLSRFGRGMSMDLQPPNYETRRAILEKKLDLMQKHIPADVVDFIAKRIQTNVRDLEHSLTTLTAYAELLNKPLTIEIAQNLLKDTFSKQTNGSIDIDTIKKVVAEHYNISVRDITGKNRNKKIMLPRQIAIYISREMLDYSFTELGDEFGGRDHTTAMHSYQKIEERLKTDSSLNSMIEMLKRQIKDYKKI
ncbi:MAG: chromosomal replication initiator protein DnaA [Treponema sp.]|nr:chromosomal replication initiator protein DnaA [Treponema sp.]